LKYELFVKSDHGDQLYGVVVVYATTEESRKGVHYINLIEKA
jgi:hypothetical protein